MWGTSGGSICLTSTVGPVSATGLLIPIIVPVSTGQTVTLSRIWGIAGGSGYLGGNFEHNGVSISGMTGEVIQYFTTQYTPSGTVNVVDGDFFNFDVTSVSTAAVSVSLTYVFTIS